MDSSGRGVSTLCSDPSRHTPGNRPSDSAAVVPWEACPFPLVVWLPPGSHDPKSGHTRRVHVALDARRKDTVPLGSRSLTLGEGGRGETSFGSSSHSRLAGKPPKKMAVLKTKTLRQRPCNSAGSCLDCPEVLGRGCPVLSVWESFTWTFTSSSLPRPSSVRNIRGRPAQPFLHSPCTILHHSSPKALSASLPVLYKTPLDCTCTRPSRLHCQEYHRLPMLTDIKLYPSKEAEPSSLPTRPRLSNSRRCLRSFSLRDHFPSVQSQGGLDTALLAAGEPGQAFLQESSVPLDLFP
jgi:hypothetical protein